MPTRPEIPFEKVRSWAFDQALPFWAAHGRDALAGGFYEELTPSGAPTACPYKRTRTMCRQTYVFSHGAALGWREGEAPSAAGFEFLVTHARLPDGGWARRLSRTGEIIDASLDLYDLAFVIFAFIWRYRASGDNEARWLAAETLDFIRLRMAGTSGGFLSRAPSPSTRHQNPHMHLAEACLAGFEATQDQIYLDTAEELVALLSARLFDGRSLGEVFNETWQRAPGELEPGHHFEWAWILAQYQRISGRPASDVATQLAAFAEQYGLHSESKAVFDAIDEEGRPARTTSRAWPNTERIKAYLGLFELMGRDPRLEVSQSLELLFSRYVAPSRPGLWIDQFDADGRPLTKAVPASCVYHFFLAFTEVLRLQPQLEAAFKGEAR